MVYIFYALTTLWCSCVLVCVYVLVCMPGSGVFLESEAGHEKFGSHIKSSNSGQRRYVS